MLGTNEKVAKKFQATVSGRLKHGRPEKYISQLSVDTGYRLEDLPSAMNERDSATDFRGFSR